MKFEIAPQGPYSLAASLVFLEGFTPAAYDSSQVSGHLHLAFLIDGSERAAGVCLQEQNGRIEGVVYGEVEVGPVRKQVRRILSLDVDGSGYPKVGQRDPVIGRLQARYPGMRPVCFYSPYEAAAWALISQRIRIVQAARVKARMAQELGTPVDIHGQVAYAFPGPSRVAGLQGFQGLFGRKVEFLRGMALAALEGRLETEYLKALPAQEALDRLKTLPGIGDFSAELVLLRGAGAVDLLPEHEPRLGRAVALAYGLKQSPDPGQLAEISAAWRPYRTWVTVLLRTFLEDETREIGPMR